MRRSKNWLSCLSLGLCLACGGPAVTSTSAKDASAPSDVAVAPDTKAPVDTGEVLAPVQSLPFTQAIKVTAGGEINDAKISGSVVQPLTCTKSAKCPMFVVVGDYDSDAFPGFEGPAKALAAKSGVILVIFNLPGTGSGAFKSTGDNDLISKKSEEWHVAVVKEIMHLYSAKENVDAKKTGYLTIGTGLISVARALKVYGSSSLVGVNYLIDVEGPTDRCAISQAPQDDAKKIGPGDGPGATDSACRFTAKGPHSAMYPAAKDGKPASIICAPGAWPISQTGLGCDINDWWLTREPAANLKDVSLRYQRIQFKYDHRLPTHWASRTAIAAVVGSQSPFFVLNDMGPCLVISEEDCDTAEKSGQSCWLSGDYGNGMAPAPYAGADFKPISIDALFSLVLPGYVERMIDEVQFPKCK